MAFRLVNVAGRAALEHAGHFFDLERASAGRLGPDPMHAVGRPEELHAAAKALDEQRPDGTMDDADLAAPVPMPRNVYAVGLNYRTHAEESGMAVPETPLIFAKFSSCITGPLSTIALGSPACDYEAELVVAIGREARNVAPEQAWDYVAGLMVGQDISDRPLQFAATPPHFDLAKSRDGFGPVGPALVSVDSVGDRDALQISCRVNGEQRQDDTTANMVFSVADLIAYLSAILTLAPGDLIFTGTPAGIGASRGEFLSGGDVITTTIEGIGTITNPCSL